MTQYFGFSDNPEALPMGTVVDSEVGGPFYSINYSTDYKNLLIKQYWNKTKASAEIELKSSAYGRVYDLLREFKNRFDIDLATGDRLDKIGELVGLKRNAANTTWGDPEYRFYLKAKISLNNSSAYLISDEYTSIQNIVQYLFEGNAYVIDNLNMTLAMMVDTSFDENYVLVANSLNLFPKPQAVQYYFISGDEDYFGWNIDPNALGFGTIFDSGVGGRFASLIV